jgi:hypothetical protein
LSLVKTCYLLFSYQYLDGRLALEIKPPFKWLPRIFEKIQTIYFFAFLTTSRAVIRWGYGGCPAHTGLERSATIINLLTGFILTGLDGETTLMDHEKRLG